MVCISIKKIDLLITLLKRINANIPKKIEGKLIERLENKIERRVIDRINDKRYLHYFLPYEDRKIFTDTGDPVRYGAIFLAINTIKKYKIPGSFAEVGVYRGETAKIIHHLYPERRLYLFDTFEGFPENDLDGKIDSRFKETSLELVKENIGDLKNIIFKKGYFPESAKGLEGETFAFVMLDVDLYRPTLDGLKFFYPKLTVDGYIFIHDYNNPESDWAVSRAVNEYMKNKPEKILEIPDWGGSVIIRKL